MKKLTIALATAALFISPLAGAASNMTTTGPGQSAYPQASGSLELYQVPGEWVASEATTSVGAMTESEGRGEGGTMQRGSTPEFDRWQSYISGH